MLRSSRHGRVRAIPAVLAATLILLVIPTVASAHAELEQATPADGATVEGTPAEIAGSFSEALLDGSSLVVVKAGRTVAEGGVDPNDPARMVAVPAGNISQGTVEVRWTAASADGHIERGTWRFTVAPAAATAFPTATPTSTATASAGPTPGATAAESASPTASAGTAPSPDSTPGPSGDTTGNVGGTGDILLPIIVGVVVLGGLGGYLLRSRTRPSGPG